MKKYLPFKKYMHILKASKLFEGINDDEIDEVLCRLSATEKNYRRDEYIFHAGERISSVALILRGSVHIQREDYWGNLSILNKISEGDVFGEAYGVSGDCAILNDVVAVENTTILFLDFNRVFSLDHSECGICLRLIRSLYSLLAEKNRILAQKLGHMSQRTTREKLLSYLSEESVKAESSSFYIPFNRQQLADFLSVDRSAMSKELCKMRDDGLLCFDRNRFDLKQ